VKVSHLHSNHSASRRTHDLRHTHKTILAELGVPEALRDERLGHRPPGMRRVYEHATPGMRKEMIDRLELMWAAVAG
jgi:integrase